MSLLQTAHEVGLACFIHSFTLCLLIGPFGPFAFKVIIDMYVLTAILSHFLSGLWFFCVPFFLCPFSSFITDDFL